MEETCDTCKPKKRGRGKYSAKEKAEVKAIYLDALVKAGGIKAPACQAARGIDARTIEVWKAEDPAFAAAEAVAMERGTEAFGDLAEGKLMQRINSGDTTAIIFALKTKFKNRGYIEKRELTANVDGLTQTILVNNVGEKSALETLDNLGV